MEKFEIEYLGSNIVIVPNSINNDPEDIYEALGEIDIVECNEISYGGESILVDSTRSIYRLTTSNLKKLMQGESAVLIKDSTLADYVDLNVPGTRQFLAWYFGTTTGHRDHKREEEQAIRMLFEEQGWVCTDPDTMQFRLELIPNKEYRFVQRNLYPDGSQIWVFDEYNIDEEEIETLIDACSSFGYSKEDVEKWISLGESTDLILECIFEIRN